MQPKGLLASKRGEVCTCCMHTHPLHQHQLVLAHHRLVRPRSLFSEDSNELLQPPLFDIRRHVVLQPVVRPRFLPTDKGWPFSSQPAGAQHLAGAPAPRPGAASLAAPQAAAFHTLVCVYDLKERFQTLSPSNILEFSRSFCTTFLLGGLMEGAQCQRESGRYDCCLSVCPPGRAMDSTTSSLMCYKMIHIPLLPCVSHRPVLLSTSTSHSGSLERRPVSEPLFSRKYPLKIHQCSPASTDSLHWAGASHVSPISRQQSTRTCRQVSAATAAPLQSPWSICRSSNRPRHTHWELEAFPAQRRLLQTRHPEGAAGQPRNLPT